MKARLKLVAYTLAALVLRLSLVFRQRTPRREARKFLVAGYTGLGNFILKTPFLKALRDAYPEAEIDILCGNAFGVEFVLKGSDLIDQTLLLPLGSSIKDQVQFYWKRRNTYDVVFLFFDTSHVNHLYLGSILANIPRRIGHIQRSHRLEWFKSLCINEPIELRLRTHEIHLNFDLLKPMGIQFSEKDKKLVSCATNLPTNIVNEMHAIGADEGNFIALQLSAANGSPTPKVWLPEYFVELIDSLTAEAKPMVIVGDKGERDYCENVLAKVKSRSKVLNLAGRTTIPEVALLLKTSRLVVCHDSGVMHVADALEKPLIAIFGPGDFEKNGPTGPRAKVVRIDLPCSPCIGLNGKWGEAEALQKCPNQFVCMKDTKPDWILREVNQLWQDA